MNTREIAPAGKRMFRDSLVVGIDFGAESAHVGSFRVSDGKLAASLVSCPDDVITEKLPGGPANSLRAGCGAVWWALRAERGKLLAMATLEQLRREVWEANLSIYRAGLVTEHAGNVSGIDRQRGLVVIKPSGVDYLKMRPTDIVVTDLEGRKVKGKWRPSVDLPHHLYLYKHCPDIGSVIHTHSNYATSFALLGRPIPVCLTAIADEFGEEIPCTPYVDNIGDHIGETILKYMRRAPAILLAQHGAFAWGPTVREAVKAAVMLEDVAKTVHLASLLGQPKPLPPEEVKKWWDRYHTTYGQKKKR